MNTELKTYSKEILFQVLSNIPLDIEGSNISNIGWYPDPEWDTEFMNKEEIATALEESKKQDEKVLFSNIYLDWDSCGCNGGMCSHGSFVVGMTVLSGEEKIEIDFVDGDSLESTHDSSFILPTKKSTVYDFYRICEIVGIKLEFSEYGHSLFQSCGLLPSELLKQRDEIIQSIPDNQEIEDAAEEYAENENSCFSNDFSGFKAGALWAIKNIVKITEVKH